MTCQVAGLVTFLLGRRSPVAIVRGISLWRASPETWSLARNLRRIRRVLKSPNSNSSYQCSRKSTNIPHSLRRSHAHPPILEALFELLRTCAPLRSRSRYHARSSDRHRKRACAKHWRCVYCPISCRALRASPPDVDGSTKSCYQFFRSTTRYCRRHLVRTSRDSGR